MGKLNEKKANSDELYNWCMKEYNSRNPISRQLIKNFYSIIEKEIISSIKSEISDILEIGCGAGESSLRIQKMLNGINYVASEYDLRYIEAINRKGLPIKVIQENVYNLTQSNSSFDCVIMLEVLEHLENISLALSELFRVSKKYVIISVPNEPLWRFCNLIRGKYIFQFGNTPGHINHFNRRKLIMSVSPFTSDIHFFYAFPWIIMLAKKR